MLLRRLMLHVRRQDWFAVGIDFLIVVFGVFFGFQVTAWNQERQDRALERGYLVRISNDIARSRDQVLRSNDLMRDQAEGATLVLRSLDTCQVRVAERDAFARALYRIGKYDAATLDQTAMEELKSTGRSTVLRNVELRQALAALSQAVEIQHRIEPQFQDRTSPFVNYIQFLVQFDVRSTAEVTGENITWRDMRIDLNAVCRDTRFRASVSAVRDITWGITYQNERILERMNAVIARIEG